MANAFNLTAQINLQGPSNVKSVVAGIKKELGTINADVNLKIDNKAVASVKKITSELKLMNNVLVNASSNAASLNRSFSSLANALGRASQASKSINTGLSQSTKSLRAVASVSKEAANNINTLGKNARATAKRFLIYTAVTRVFYGFTNAIDSAFRRYIEFDKQLVRLQQVTRSGSVGISGIVQEIDKLSVSLGVSTEKLTQTSVTLAQAGFTAEETRAALSALAKTELAPTFDDITRTTEGAIAAIRQFGLETTQLESILGSINAVSARFAVESSDIIAAIQRTGGVFASASKGVKNLDGSLKTGEQALQEFTAVFTSVRASTRESAETIATGLRTIFTRIQRGSTIEYLKQFNIELQDLEGNFVGPYEAVRRLAAGLKDLDPRDVRFNRIVEELGGFRQIGKVIPLLQNFAEAERALATAQSGTTSLEGDRVKALQSLSVQFARVNEQAFSLFKTIGDSKVFKGFLSIILSITSGLISLAKTFKPLLPFLAILGTIKIAKSAFNFVSGAAGAIKAGGGAKGVGAGIGRSLTGTTDSKKDQSVGAITQNTSALKSLTNAVLNLTNRINRSPGPRGFATGGIVPGSGNRDTVPAMLTPGEFVIRKKAVETIGAGNLHKMNKYSWGGKVSTLADEYTSIQNIDNYEQFEDDIVRDRSKFIRVQPTNQDKQAFKNIKAPTNFKRFETFVGKKYSLGNPAKGRFDYLDFPDSRSEAKFLPLGETYSNSEKGNTPKSIAAKNFLFENSAYRPNRKNKEVKQIETVSLTEPVNTYWADPKDFYNLGGAIKKYNIGGGVLATDTVGAAIMEKVGNLTPTIIPGSEIISNTLKDRKLEDDALADMEKRLQAIFGNRSYNLVRQGLDGALGENVEGAINSRVVEMMNNLGVDLGFPGIAEGAGEKFLTSLNDGVRSGIFEAVLNTIKNSGIYQVAQTASDRNDFFDFRDGLGAASKWFPNLKEISFVDAKKSVDSASPSAMARKIGNEGLREAGSMSLEQLSKMAEEAQSRSSIEDTLLNAITQEFGSGAFGRGTILPLIDEGKESENPSIAGKLRGIYERLGLSPQQGNSILRKIFGTATGKKWDGKAVSLANRLNFGGFVQKFAEGGQVESLVNQIQEMSAIDAIDFYTNKSRKLNTYYDQGKESELNDTYKAAAKTLDQLFNDDIPGIVYAGFGASRTNRLLGNPDNIMDLENVIGNKVTFPAYFSTSEYRDIASDFSQRGGGLNSISDIRTKGKGIDVEAAFERAGAEGRSIERWNTGEYEYILPRGSSFRIDNAENPEGGQSLQFDLTQLAKGGMIQRFEEGGESKKNKEFGKMILSMDGNEGRSYYSPNDTRTGFVQFKKWKNNLWTVGLSKATKGYGPKLYDVAMEAVTEQGGMLTSDRAIVSKDAQNVWQYYFKNRGDVKKTPLDPTEWTGNYALIDPKLHGKKETWPPATDPAWVLQSGYSKQPSIINDEETVKRAGRQSGISSAAVALSYFSRYANGGAAEDTVPALLTPGEFVINKKAAARIGASNLHRMNRADKIQGYNSGGSVGFIQRFAGGGVVDDPLVLDVYADAAEKAGQTLEEFSKSLKEASKQIFQQNKQRIKETRTDLKTNIIRTRSTGFGSEDDVQNFQRDLGAQLAGILGDGISGERLQDALDEIAIGLMDNKSLPELIDTIPELASAFDEGADSYRANFRVQKELESEYGGLIQAVKLSAKDLEEIEWREKGGAEKLGGVGKAADIAQSFGIGGGAYGFAQSEAGKKIVALQKKYDNFGKTLVTRLGGVSPKLGKLAGGLGGFAKVLGGMPAVVSAAAGVLSDQLLPSLISMAGLSGTATGAGIQEAVRQGSSQATAFAAIGNAILPGIGGLVMGIAGAISGALTGFIQGFRTKKIENSINKLNGTMKQVDKTFADYEAVQSQENLDRIYKSVADANVASMALEEQGRFTQGDRLRQGATGAINAGALAGGAAAVLAIAGVLTGGAALAIAATAAAVYGLFSYLTAVPDELDNQALEAYLGNLGEFNKAIEGLARINLEKQTIDEIDRALNAIKAGDLTSSVLVQEGKKAGLSSNDVFRRAAQERLYEQSGGNIDLYRRTVSDMGGEDSQKILELGKEIVKQKTEQLLNEQRQAALLRDVNIEVENILDQFQKLNAVIQRVGSDLDELDTSIENQMSSLRGEGRVREAGRRDINILQNARGYSAEEVRGAAARAGNIIGGERGRQVQSAVESKRILDEELPKILASANSQNVDEVIGKIDQALIAGSIDRNTVNQITGDLEKKLADKIGSRQGISLEELSQDVPALTASLKALDEQNKAAVAASELFAKALDQSTKYANEYIKALDEASERELAGIKAKIEGENRIAEALGKRLTMEQRTADFFAEFDSLAPGMRDGGQIDIAKVVAERERVRGQITDLEKTKANTDPQNTKELVNLQERLAELNAADADLVKSLEFVADSNQLLTAALNAYQERMRKEDSQLGFLDKILTGTPQDIAQMSTDMNAFNVALAGDPRARQAMFSTTEGRESALRGSQMALDLFGADDAQSRRIQAQLRLGMLEGMGPEMQRIINQEIPGMDGEMTTLKKILEQRADPTYRSPEEEKAQAALDLQQRANEALLEMRQKQADEMFTNIGKPIKEAIDKLPASIAAALKDTSATSTTAGATRAGGGAGTAGTGGGAGTAGTMMGGGTGFGAPKPNLQQAPITGYGSAYFAATMTDVELAEREKQLKADINNLESDSGNLRARRDAALNRATDTGDQEWNPYETRDDEGRREAIDKYTESVVRLNNAQKELEEIKAARMQKSIEVMGGTAKPDRPIPTDTGVSYDVPSAPVPSVSQQSVGIENLPSLGDLDISGLLTTLGNVDSSLQSLTTAFSLSTTAFEQIKSYLDSYTVPLVLDEQSTSALSSFNADFNRYVTELSKINLPDTITINARHTVVVDIRGAEVFGQLDEGLQRTVVAAVNRELNRQTDGALGRNYQS